MLPDLSGIDCKKAVDYFTIEGFLSTDAWLIIPFILGMLFYSLRSKIMGGIISSCPNASSNANSMELSERKLGFEEKKAGYGYRRGSEMGGNSFA